MADFQNHINQANRNLAILEKTNNFIDDSWDWQVTTAYYVAVHLMNAHLAKTANLHYTTHDKVKNALFNVLSPAKIDQTIYLEYVKLENLSRRSRYLCNDSAPAETGKTFLTYDVHLKRALEKLDSIMKYMAKEHKLSFSIIQVDCIEIKPLTLTYFKYRQKIGSVEK
ncbi:MAG TPA: hypothetical protein VL490_05955 [Mucilaginibacter sp.]|jgi:hypothetical protein|nr:hypothetical protein [Mucilaginibacter sp.]